MASLSDTAFSFGTIRHSRTLYSLMVVLSITITVVLFSEVITRIFLTSPSRQRFGFNDIDLSDNHNPNRWIVTGDSMTEAIQVPRPSNYVWKLRQKCTNADFLNLGRAASGPLEYYLLLERFAKLTGGPSRLGKERFRA